MDPVMSYVLLGESVKDGLFAWLSPGINATYSGEVNSYCLFVVYV